MEQKQKLNIQTREEFEKPRYSHWNFKEEQKAVAKGRLESEIKSLRLEIERKVEEIKELKASSFKKFCEENTYEDWVKQVRRQNSEDYEIVENEDSKEVA